MQKDASFVRQYLQQQQADFRGTDQQTDTTLMCSMAVWNSGEILKTILFVLWEK